MTPADVFFAAAQVGGTIVTATVVFAPGLVAAAGAVSARAIVRAHYRRVDNRAAAVELAQQARADDIQLRWAQEAAAHDTEPGIHLNLRDQCDQILAAGTAGRRNTRTEGNR